MIKIERDAAKPAYIVRASGALADSDLGKLKSKLEELIEDEIAPGILFDLRDITDVRNLTSDFLRSLPTAEHWRGCQEPEIGRRAMLVSSDLLAGLARLYQGNAGLQSDDDFKVFREPRPALEYIGFLDPLESSQSGQGEED